MSNYASLKSAIQQVIKTNGKNKITGALLQQSLLSMINSLGVGYQFVGIATPSTNPGTPDQKVFYIANGKGTYTNFGGINVTEDEVIFLVLDNAWHKAATGIAASSTASGGASVTVDSSLSATSTNPVQNKVVKAALDAKQDRMTIDSALSATSANPVQNKAVKAALDGKQDKLTAGSGIIINGNTISSTASGGISMTVDAALSSTSTNPVQNKVVKAALDAKQAKLTAGSGVIINGSEISTAYKIWHGSQAEYDAIAAKDDMTIYLIEES